MKWLNESQIRGQAFRDDWCEVEPIYSCFFSRRISELASSLEVESKFANFQSPTQSSHPHPAPQHCRTAELRVVGIETSRTESLTEEPSPERSSHVPPTHPRNDYQSLRWPNSFTQRVYESRKKRNCGTAVITHGFWAHIGSIPWATSN